jgi:hypothetical protein
VYLTTKGTSHTGPYQTTKNGGKKCGVTSVIFEGGWGDRNTSAAPERACGAIKTEMATLADPLIGTRLLPGG